MFSCFSFGLLRTGNRSSLLCAPLSRSVRSPRPKLSQASGRASWLRSTGAHVQIRSKALLCARSRCVTLLQLYQSTDCLCTTLALCTHHRAILSRPQDGGRSHQHRAVVLLRGYADHEGVPSDLEGSSPAHRLAYVKSDTTVTLCRSCITRTVSLIRQSYIGTRRARSRKVASTSSRLQKAW